MKITVAEAMKSKTISFWKFRDILSSFSVGKNGDGDLGSWDEVCSEYDIEKYAEKMRTNGYDAKYLKRAMRNQFCKYGLWHAWLDGSPDIPVPINNKKSLYLALQLPEECLDYVVEILDTVKFIGYYRHEDADTN